LALIAGVAVSAVIGGLEATGHGQGMEGAQPGIHQIEKTTERPF
jgi:hypothetical protein